MLNTAVKWGYLNASPARHISRLGGEEQRDRYLTNEEIKKILDVAWPRIRTFFLFAINTGMRCDNIKTLQWKDVHWQSGTINVPKNKSDKAYSVPINNTVRGILQERAKLGTQGPVLDTTNLRKDFEELRAAAGIENCTIHDLRHTFASHLAMKGVDLYTIAKLLGHSDIKMTQRYAHLAPDHKSIAVGLLNFEDPEKRSGGTSEPGVVTKQRENSAVVW
jgi:integrase